MIPNYSYDDIMFAKYSNYCCNWTNSHQKLIFLGGADYKQFKIHEIPQNSLFESKQQCYLQQENLEPTSAFHIKGIMKNDNTKLIIIDDSRNKYNIYHIDEDKCQIINTIPPSLFVQSDLYLPITDEIMIMHVAGCNCLRVYDLSVIQYPKYSVDSA